MRRPIETVVARLPARVESPPPAPVTAGGQPVTAPLDLHLAIHGVVHRTPAVAAQAGTADSASPASAAAAAPAAAIADGQEAPVGAAQPDLGEIADNVYRIIRRRLAAERERAVGRR